MNGILQWGFWAGAHWIPDAALYNLYWTPRTTGLAFEELMLKDWITDTILYSDKNGFIDVRGFHGDYEIESSFIDGGDTTLYSKTSFTLLKNRHDTIPITINTVLSARSIAIKGNLNVYPNPAGNDLFINFKSDVEFNLIILDYCGNEIRQIRLENDENPLRINLRGLASGLYFIRLINPEKNYTGRFIKL